MVKLRGENNLVANFCTYLYIEAILKTSKMPQIFQKTAKVNPSPQIGNIVLLSETEEEEKWNKGASQTYKPRKGVFDKC